MAGLAASTSLPRNMAFPGVITSGQTGRPVVIPAGVPLDRIIVAEGETVAAGQTVATLDRQALAEALSAVERELLVERIGRDCRLGSPLPDSAIIEHRSISPETKQRARTALRICRTETDALRARLEDGARSIAAIDTRLAEIARHIALALEAPLAGQSRRAAAEQAIRLDRERNSLTAQKAAVMAMTLNHELVARQDRDAALIAANDRITRALALQDLLEGALKSPRIAAPAAGKVRRVRAFAQGQTLPEATELVEIVEADGPAYTASVELPVGVVDGLDGASTLKIAIAGFPRFRRMLSGRVISTRPTAVPDRVIAVLRLSPEDEARLEDKDHGLALPTTSASGNIFVSLAPVTVDQAIGDVLSAMLDTGIVGRVPLVMESGCAECDGFRNAAFTTGWR